jgi:hypothetical protein
MMIRARVMRAYMDHHFVIHGGIIMVDICGSDILNLSKFVQDTFESVSVYGNDSYDDEDSVEE